MLRHAEGVGPRCVMVPDCLPQQGLGHLRRCLGLAAALERHGLSVDFWVPPGRGSALTESGAAHWLEGRVTPASLPPASDILVIDSYTLGDSDFAGIGATSRMLVVIDDQGQRRLSCDVYLNHNVFAPDLDLHGVEAGVKLLGPQYALIDPRFAALRNHADRRGVLVSFGGTDDGRLALRVLRALPESVMSRRPFHMVVPAGIAPDHGLLNLVAEHESLRLHHGADMSELMAECGTYVGAAGHTSLEAAAAGLDVLICVIAENQRANAKALSELGAVVIDSFDSPILVDVVRRVPTVTGSNGLATVIDGQGVARAATAIVACLARFSDSSIRQRAGGTETWSG
jgi:UDP-2,4-diacetamido-2,4,6-trideoxy-beta-L-altropyranose hydrolase